MYKQKLNVRIININKAFWTISNLSFKMQPLILAENVIPFTLISFNRKMGNERQKLEMKTEEKKKRKNSVQLKS